MKDPTFLDGISDGLTPDKYGRIWPEGMEVCVCCGQPDNCGDCSHGKLSAEDVENLLGYPPCPL
jgi:hypothetical protein